MAPSPAKRAKVAHGVATGGIQANLRDLFARSTEQRQHQPQPQAQRSSLAGSSSATDNISTQQREEEELRWAIRESLMEAERVRKNDKIDSDGQAQPLQRHVENVITCQRNSEDLDSDDAIVCSPPSKTSKQPMPQTCFAGRTQLSTQQTQAHPDVPPQPSPCANNAFSKLMSTHSEAKEWATADVVEKRNYTGAARSRVQHRTAPFYKVLTGMPISVDAFRFGEIEGCEAYFLSHFHSDHYGGLTNIWTHGPIYCSITTANLVRSSLRVQDHYVCPLPMNEPFVIPRTGGVRVTLLDANHCPGSCVFFFEGPQTRHILPTTSNYSHPALTPPHVTCRYLHCGDFRASPRHANHPLIKGRRIDIIYLDTTYCNPRYCFPAQEQVVNACAEMLHRVVPEQCRRGQLASGATKEEVEDWRTSPLRGNRLKAALQAEEDMKGANALRDWLGGNAKIVSTESHPCKPEPAETCEVKVEEGSRQDEDDLSAMDFLDEELGFARGGGDHMSIDAGSYSGMAGDGEDEDDTSNALDQTLTDQSTVKGEGEAESTFTVKQEQDTAELDDEDEAHQDDLEADEAAGLALPFSSPKREQEGQKLDQDRKDLLDIIEEDYPRALVVVGTYTIGKEKIVMACAKALGTRVFCADPRKYRVYAQLDDPELHSMLTRNPMDAYVHVTNLHAINGDALKEHTSKLRSQGMRIDRAIAFRPTGWTYKPPAGMDVVSPSLDRLIRWNQRRLYLPSHMFTTRDSTHEYSIYGVPYSEHSSFFELTAFCLSVDYARIIATVNVGNPASRAKMARWFEKWKAEKKRRDGVAIEPRSEDFF